MTPAGKERRRHERKQLLLPIRVRGYESLGSEWNEISRFLDVSPFGARFILSRLTEVGRILHLTVPMPRQYRCYDFAEDQYKVWSLVTRAVILESTEEQKMSLDVAVAFVGQHPPASYMANPLIRYEAMFSAETGQVSGILERQNVTTSYSANQQHEGGYRIPIDALLDLLNTSGQVIRSENTVTEEISRSGVSVFTEFDVAVGQFVRLTLSQFPEPIVAVVRASYTEDDGLTRLGLEYVNGEISLPGIE